MHKTVVINAVGLTQNLIGDGLIPLEDRPPLAYDSLTIMIERIQELLRKDPFTPFRLILTSGNSYDVLSPWMLAFGKTELAYFYPKSDRLAELRINQLAALETMEPQGA